MAWTTAVTVNTGQHKYVRGDGRILTCFILTVTSDASGSGDLTLSTELATTYGANKAEQLMQDVRGSSVYQVNYYASGAPDAPTTASLITVDNEEGLIMFSDTVGTAGTSEALVNDAANAATSGPIRDAIIAMGTLANTKKATVHFWFIR